MSDILHFYPISNLPDSAQMSTSPLAKKPRHPVGDDETEEENPAVTRFREYLRIPTVSVLPEDTDSPKPDYDLAVRFLVRMAEEIGLSCKCVEVATERIVVLMTCEGTRPELKAVMLNSHYDVGDTPEKWSVPPFSAHKRENGDIVARGSQDMKCVGMQYLEAVRRMKAAGKKFPRTIHITFQPDESIGSALGMQKWVCHEEFRKLRVGFALDEGQASPTEAFTVFYGERAPWWLVVTCTGVPGHAAGFLKNTAAEKMFKVVQSAMAFREEQEQKLKSDPSLKLGDVTSINLTKIQGGVQYNRIPEEMTVAFDLRVSPKDDPEEVLSRVQQWVSDAGEGCTLSFAHKDSVAPLTSTDPSDPWWAAFSGACSKRGMKLDLQIFSCFSDARYLRALCIPALGFSPINNTPILCFNVDEFLNERIFITGIEIYEDILAALASVM